MMRACPIVVTTTVIDLVIAAGDPVPMSPELTRGAHGAWRERGVKTDSIRQHGNPHETLRVRRILRSSVSSVDGTDGDLRRSWKAGRPWCWCCSRSEVRVMLPSAGAVPCSYSRMMLVTRPGAPAFGARICIRGGGAVRGGARQCVRTGQSLRCHRHPIRPSARSTRGSADTSARLTCSRKSACA